MNSYYYYYYYYKARTPLVLGTSSPPVLLIAIRIARASALKADSALTSQTLACYPFILLFGKTGELTCGGCFLLGSSQCEGLHRRQRQTIEEGETPFPSILPHIVSHETLFWGGYIQSPTFSRVKGRWHIKYGREEMSITALESDYTSGEQH